jgi:uncharacterized membrane protein
MKNRFSAALFALAFFVPLAFASCPYLGVSIIDSAIVQAGIDASYPITLTNTGFNSQLVKLSAVCPEDLFCSFDFAYDTLVPSQTKTFIFNVDTTEAKSASYSIPLGISLGAQTQDCEVQQLSLFITGSTPTPSPQLPPFSVSMTPVENRSTRPGNTLEYEISITSNIDSTALSFAQLSAIGAFKDSTTFDYVDLNLNAFETKKIKARVSVPPGTPAGVYNLLFNVRGVTNYGEQFTYQLPTQVFVFSKTLNLVLLDEPIGCASVKHGEEMQVTMRVRNDGESEGPFSLSIEGTEEVKDFVSVSPQLLEIKPGDRQEVTISIEPSSGVLLDRYEYNFVLRQGGFTVFQKPLCVFIYSVNDFSIVKNKTYTITRGSVNVLLPFTIKNDGTLAENFSIEVRPPATLLVQPEPSYFRLSPGESKEATLVVSTSLQRTPLGAIKIPVIVRTSKVGKLIDFNLTLVSSDKQGESYLTVLTQSLHVLSGKQVQESVSVTNTKTSVLHGVRLQLEGDGKSWASVDPAVQDIGAGKTAVYRIFFNVPSTQPEASLSTTLHLTSLEGEELRYPVALYVSKPKGQMDFLVQDTQFVSDSNELVITVVVRNTGDSVLDGISPSLTGFAVSSTPSAISLAPGEERKITLTVKNPPGESVPIALRSNEGVETSVTNVQVKKAGSQPSLLLIALLILIALLLAYSIFGRHDNGQAESETKYLP